MNLGGYKKLEYAINKRSSKSRWILLSIGMLFIYFIWNNLVYQKITVQIELDAAQLKVKQTGVDDAQKKLDDLMVEIKKNPIKALENQRDLVLQEVNKIDAALKAFMSNLVDPKAMLPLLKEMLESQASLTLIKMENKAPELIKVTEPATKGQAVKGADAKKSVKNKTKTTDSTASTVSTTPAAPTVSTDPVAPAAPPPVEAASSKMQMVLYKHSLEMTFSGTFFKIMDYLKQLEGLDKKIIWDSLSYTVKEYPMAEVNLIVMTLSTDSGWLGV